MSNAIYSVCKLCGAETLTCMFTSRYVSAPVYRCRTCGLRFVGKLFTTEEQADFYGDPEQYHAFAHAERAAGKAASWHRDWIEAIASAIGLNDFHSRNGRKPRLIDVGCGVGDFLVAARDSGFEVYGVDLSAAAIDLAKSWNGLDVRLGGIEAESRDGFFDVVTSIGLLEHVIDPSSLLFHTRRVLLISREDRLQRQL